MKVFLCVKNILLVFAALFIIGRAEAQNIKELEKYSYFCFAVNKDKALNGTCFFYKNADNVYLVTNYHVFYGADILNNKLMLPVDTLRISYVSSKTHKQKFFKISNGEDKVQFFKHYEAPDLMAKKISNVPDDFIINYVNDMLEPSVFKQTPDSVIVFGYPALYNHIAGTENVNTQRCYITGNFDGSVDLFDHSLFRDAAIKNVDRVKRKIDKKEFEITVGSLPGFSGSPVYGRFRKKGGYEYRFIGVIFASDMMNNTSVAINGNTFVNYMKTCMAE